MFQERWTLPLFSSVIPSCCPHLLSCLNATVYWVVSGKRGFPGGSLIQRICLQCRSCRFELWVEKIPPRRAWQLTVVFLPGNPMNRGAWKATVHATEHAHMWTGSRTGKPWQDSHVLERKSPKPHLLLTLNSERLPEATWKPLPLY